MIMIAFSINDNLTSNSINNPNKSDREMNGLDFYSSKSCRYLYFHRMYRKKKKQKDHPHNKHHRKSIVSLTEENVSFSNIRFYAHIFMMRTRRDEMRKLVFFSDEKKNTETWEKIKSNPSTVKIQKTKKKKKFK